MLWHAIRALGAPQIEAVFVVLSPQDVHFANGDWDATGVKVEPLYCGGASRAESVRNGLVAAMSTLEADDWILVHDAARPCLPSADLNRLIAEASGDAIGAILAQPVAETVKRAAKDEAGTQRVAGTDDRTLLWLAQTPQMFRAGLLAEALRRPGRWVTDEASAVEALGLQPRLIAGSRENLKVTYPEDLAIAASILAARDGRKTG